MPMRPVSEWNFIHWIVAFIVIAGCVAIAYVAINAMGIAIPFWIERIFWIVIIVVFSVAAIMLLYKIASKFLQ